MSITNQRLFSSRKSHDIGKMLTSNLLLKTSNYTKAFVLFSWGCRKFCSILDANSKTEVKTLVSCTYDQNKITELLSEMAELKQRNESMEAELKEMQERYSDMSLKFAEVEGERQQLIIRIRSLKNALKN